MLPETLQTRLAADVLPMKSSPLLLEPLVPPRSQNVSCIHTRAIKHGGCRINAKGVDECIPEAERGFEYKREEDRVSSCSNHLSEDESSYDGSENAIKDEDDSSQWTDSKTKSDNSSSSDDQLFQRVKLSTKILRQRSFLTAKLNKEQQNTALFQTASNSERPLQQPQTSLPSGPHIAKSTEGRSAVSLTGLDIPRLTPADITTSNSRVMADSTRQIRESMFAAEMTGSLKRHLIWERQDKRTTVGAVLKRKGTAMKIPNSQHSFDNERDYHVVGW